MPMVSQPVPSQIAELRIGLAEELDKNPRQRIAADEDAGH